METKELIKQKFIEVYSKMPYEKITIKSLCDSIPIARTTFYTYFQNIDEVKESVENETIKGIRTSCEKIYESDDDKYFMAAIEYINNHKNIFYCFLAKQPNLRFIDKFKLEIINHFNDNFSNKKHNKNYNLELEIFASAVISFYTYMLKYPDEIDFKNLSDKFKIIKKSLSLFF